MKTPLLIRLCLVAATLSLSACGGGGSSPPNPPRKPYPPPQVELQKQVEVERALRTRAETHLEQQEASTGHYQNLALLFSLGVVVALVAGTIIGSQARHEAEKQNPTP